MDKAKDRNDTFRLMGFGHRVYKTTDARAKVIRQIALDLVEKLAPNDPLLDIALRLEEVALADDYFISRRLYPNVDFYSGIIYRAIGFPDEMFTPLFVVGRDRRVGGPLAGAHDLRRQPHRAADPDLHRPRRAHRPQPRQADPVSERQVSEEVYVLSTMHGGNDMLERPESPNPYDLLPKVPSFDLVSNDISEGQRLPHDARQRLGGRART